MTLLHVCGNDGVDLGILITTLFMIYVARTCKNMKANWCFHPREGREFPRRAGTPP